jgi:hypothetical protein
MAAVGNARNRSVRFDQKAAREQIDALAKLTIPVSQYEYIVQTLFHPEPAHSFGYELFGFVAEGGPPSAMTDGMVHHLVTVQAADVLALTRALPIGHAPGKPAAPQQTPPAPMPRSVQNIDFVRQIKPLLERSCAACHSGEKPRGLFRIDGRDAILKGGASGAAAIVPGHSEKSLLIAYVSGKAPESEMPPRAVRDRFPALSPDEVALVRAWVDQGAEWPTGVSLTLPQFAKQP